MHGIQAAHAAIVQIDEKIKKANGLPAGQAKNEKIALLKADLAHAMNHAAALEEKCELGAGTLPSIPNNQRKRP